MSKERAGDLACRCTALVLNGNDFPTVWSASNQLVELIRKLRWMGMDEEAKKVERQLTLCKVPASDSVVARSRETNTLRHYFDRAREAGQSEGREAKKEHDMSGTLINLIIQIIAGVVGGHAAGAALKSYTFGATGNTIAGAIGGTVGGQLLQAWVPALASAASNVDIAALIAQIVGGGAGGAILTVLAGVTKWIVVPPKST